MSRTASSAMIGMKIASPPARSSTCAISAIFFGLQRLLLMMIWSAMPMSRATATMSGSALDVELVVDVDEDPVPGDREHLAQRRYRLLGRGAGALDHQPALLELGQRAFREARRLQVELRSSQESWNTTNSPSLDLLDVQLDHLGAELDRAPDGGDGILRMAGLAGVHAAAAMRHDHHMVAPAIGVFEPLADLADARALGVRGKRRSAAVASADKPRPG